MTAPTQDKQKEIAFFDGHAAADDYDVFTPEGNARIVNAFVKLTALPRGARVIDLGCGSGTFTALLAQAGYDCVGVDISAKLLEIGRRKHPQIEFVAGDIEHLPFPAASFDGVLLSGVVHHFPDPSPRAARSSSCRSTTSSTAPSSALPRWSGCAPSCSPPARRAEMLVRRTPALSWLAPIDPPSLPGLTRQSILFSEMLFSMDARRTRACPSSAHQLSAASRVNPTCGVKPGHDR